VLKILYIDDEPALRSAFRRLFRQQHDVTIAENAEVALDLLKKFKFDVVVSDVIMPGLTGPDLCLKVREFNPDLARRFIFVSGGFDRGTGQKLGSLTNRLLMKPYRREDMADAIQAITSV